MTALGIGGCVVLETPGKVQVWIEQAKVGEGVTLYAALVEAEQVVRRQLNALQQQLQIERDRPGGRRHPLSATY